MSKKATIVCYNKSGELEQKEIEYNGDVLVLVKVGSESYPASPAMLNQVEKDIISLLESESDKKIMIWNHAINIEILKL